MTNSFDSLDARQIDILREIGNIGAGNAATALANMLNKRISMSVPEVNMVPFNDIINILNGPESLVAGILVDFSGDMNGYVMMVLELPDAYEVISLVLGEEHSAEQRRDDWVMDELESSALTEVANILVGAYLSAICSLTQLTVMPTVPELAIDMVGAIMSIVAIEYGQIGDSVLFMRTAFADDERELNGHFFLIPDYESYKILMKSLGLEM